MYIAFPNYKADGYPFTGHAGILLIDNKSGLTKYYEYGRYDNNLGNVRNYKVSNVTIENDKPTASSLDTVLGEISKKSGKNNIIEAAYFESNNFDIMNNYAQEKLEENKNVGRKPYSIWTNNCGTFANDVINQDNELNTPSIIDSRPVSIVKEYQEVFTPISHDPNKGTTIKYNEKTINYDNATKQTTSHQNWWQKIVY